VRKSFAELQKVEEVLDATAFKQAWPRQTAIGVLVHCGSRDWANPSCGTTRKEMGRPVATAKVFAGSAYLRDHDLAVRWAEANRALIARRFAEALGAKQNSYGTAATTASRHRIVAADVRRL